MAKLFRLAVFIAYLGLLSITVGVALTLIQSLFIKLSHASEGSYAKFGEQISRDEHSARMLGFGFQGRTDFFLDYQIELGVISKNNVSGEINEVYGSGALGATAGSNVFAKYFLGLGLNTIGSLQINNDLELGLKGESGVSIGVFFRRSSELKLLSLPFGRDFIGAKVQIPI